MDYRLVNRHFIKGIDDTLNAVAFKYSTLWIGFTVGRLIDPTVADFELSSTKGDLDYVRALLLKVYPDLESKI